MVRRMSEAATQGQTPTGIVAGRRKVHVTRDGQRAVCGAGIARDTEVRWGPDWYLNTDCYNCVYRLWPEYGPAGYACPRNGRDFPPPRLCPHGAHPAGCPRCTGLGQLTIELYRPPRRLSGHEGRCVDGCESRERVLARANPALSLDLADSAMMTCYHCGEYVCVACQTAPVDGPVTLCDNCP